VTDGRLSPLTCFGSGYIAAFSETLALACIVSKAVAPLKEALVMEPEDHVKAATAWTLGEALTQGAPTGWSIARVVTPPVLLS
jgi:hypothetical protein